MMKLKYIATSLLVASLMAINSRADEGMWLPSLISQRIGDMQAKGFKLNAEDIYSINQASLKDAVVLFGRGCTGELISAEGLLVTNHHCGYGQIQKHSSVEHDYLKDGFWAMDRSQELPNKGLTVSFLERMEDVTKSVLKGYKKNMSEAERAQLVNKNISRLVKAATSEGKGLRATVEALYYGNQYFLFVYREYSDVRLVGAPPSSIGKFGGDTDNWMWPRHTGDFSIFRIYADKDNNPSEYSTENVPYKPKKFFKISTLGVKEGDFTFIYGFPGRTQEYIHSEDVRYIAQIGDPHKINLRTQRLAIQDKHMGSSQKVRIQYSSKNASVANSWKKWQGEMKGILKMNTVESKKQYELAFEKWAKGTKYEGITDSIASLCNLLAPYRLASDYYSETARTIEIARFAMSMAANFRAEDSNWVYNSELARETATAFYKDYYLPIDKECFVAVMSEFGKNMPDEFQPEYYKSEISKYGTVETWAEELFSNSVFADENKTLALTLEDKDLVMSDPALKFDKMFSSWYLNNIRPKLTDLNTRLQLAYRTYMRGQMKFSKSNKAHAMDFYPDANLTLRVAYGNVKGYTPADGIYYIPYTTIKGIMEKDNPDIFDYNIPQKLRDIYASKDYGRWTNESGEVPVCFLATNHTTGGNSGSPVINADGNLIGLNFDRVWEGTMSDIDFDPDICRNITLDIRYVLFTIEKIGGASYLFDEMVFAK